MSFGRHAP